MSILDYFMDELEVIEASAEQAAARAAALGDRGTAGPEIHPDQPAMRPTNAPRWSGGWWEGAKRADAHPGRIGGAITPWSIGVHSTDMPDEDWTALVASWQGRAGDGACANFLLGRREAQGLLQLVPITRNSNHMGGPGHGVFDTARATSIHPNLVTVSIEIHCAGGVRRIGGVWRFVENGAAHGRPIPDDEVIPDPQRPGRGWHTITDYQRFRLAQLLTEIDPALAPMPSGATTRAFGEVPSAFAVMPTARIVTHAQMDPVHRADPWHPTCDWLRARSGSLP